MVISAGHALLRKAVIGVVIIAALLADAFWAGECPRVFFLRTTAIQCCMCNSANRRWNDDHVLKGRTSRDLRRQVQNWWLQFVEPDLSQLPGVLLHEFQTMG